MNDSYCLQLREVLASMRARDELFSILVDSSQSKALLDIMNEVVGSVDDDKSEDVVRYICSKIIDGQNFSVIN
jgi:hypothetical protein